MDNLWFDDLCAEQIGDRLSIAFSCDVVLCGWLGSKYQLTNYSCSCHHFLLHLSIQYTSHKSFNKKYMYDLNLYKAFTSKQILTVPQKYTSVIKSLKSNTSWALSLFWAFHGYSSMNYEFHWGNDFFLQFTPVSLHVLFPLYHPVPSRLHSTVPKWTDPLLIYCGSTTLFAYLSIKTDTSQIATCEQSNNFIPTSLSTCHLQRLHNLWPAFKGQVI